ncbi:MAG: thiamine phosphate synthase [Zoogloeaceae bacterium]|jgi:thiamine-phosphate pyrophosphorylase|nr:thiamine phosphate synthase [Zoogloeaceae bacterium]
MRPLRGLYAIPPDGLDTPTRLAASEAVLSGGCRLLQYRDKTSDTPKRRMEANALRDLCERYNAALIVNDDIALARAVGAAGVHLGRDDGSPVEARRILGAKAVIGVSCYDDFARAREMIVAGADYIAFGAVCASVTKPDAVRAPLELFHRARNEFSIPACAIGGITLEKAPSLVEAGAMLLAVIHDLFASLSGANRDSDARLADILAGITARARAYQSLFKDVSSS